MMELMWLLRVDNRWLVRNSLESFTDDWYIN